MVVPFPPVNDREGRRALLAENAHPVRASVYVRASAAADSRCVENPGCGLHAFRHSHSSMLLESGAPVSVVQAQLGHTDPSITLGIYSHVIGTRNAVPKRG